MLVLADTRLAIRQAFATGQLTEEITGRAIENFEISMAYSHAGGAGELPLSLQKKPGGFFALQLSPERGMPDFSDQTDVTLTARVAIQGKAPFDVRQNVTSPDLALTETVAKIGGTPVTYHRIKGAPFDFSAQLAPDSVALQGIVLREHDPAEPISGIIVTTTPAAPGGAVTSDAEGIFYIPALPVAEELTLGLNEAGTLTNLPFRPDFDRPVNTLILSLVKPSNP